MQCSVSSESSVGSVNCVNSVKTVSSVSSVSANSISDGILFTLRIADFNHMRMTRIAGSQSCYESPGCEIPWLSRTVDKSMRFCISQTCALVRVNRGGLSPFTSGRKSLCRLQHLKLKVMQALAFHTQSQISKLWEVWRSPIMNFSTNLVLDYNVVREFEKDRAIMNVLWMAVFFDRENSIF